MAGAVEGSVAEAAGGERKVAVAFSGGLDSSIVATCAKAHAQVVACTAYAEGSRDSTWAKKSAATLHLEIVETKLTSEVAAASLEALSLPFVPSLMDRSLWCLYTVVSKSARESGAKVILLGQLADELFGGYAKYKGALEAGGEAAAREMMNSDFLEYGTRGKVRDFGACGHHVEPRLPFASKAVAELASTLPMSFLIRDGVRKAVLRRAAVILGVPEELAEAAKKAAQYSSGVQRLVAALPF